MVTVTVSVPAELKGKMDEFGEMNWSEVARQAFARKVGELEFMRKFTSDSTLTEEETIELGRKVSAALGKRLLTLAKKSKR